MTEFSDAFLTLLILAGYAFYWGGVNAAWEHFVGKFDWIARAGQRWLDRL